MSIDRLRAHWGLSRTPFTKELAPSMLFALGRSPGSRRTDRLDHHRAGARRCVRRGRRRQDGRCPRRERRPGSEPAHDHLPPEPGDRRARDLHPDRLRARLDTPRFYRATLIPQATDLLAAESSRARQDRRTDLGRGASAVGRAARGAADADELRDGLPRDVRVPAARAADAAPQAQPGRVRRAGSADRAAVHDRRDGSERDRRVHRPPRQARRPLRHAVLR